MTINRLTDLWKFFPNNWLDELGHIFDTRLCDSLVQFFAGKTVVDLGCGPGEYCKHISKVAKIDGFDGNPLTVTLTEGRGKVLDLSQPVNLGLYDWVLSLEVGEHIPQQYERVFIDNIHRSNREGVILSWAVENQPGRGHVNCRNNDYIKDIFSSLGYANDLLLEQHLRSNVEYPWFLNTLMVFRK